MSASPPRVHSLDLLRGLAAFVVLAHHTLLLDPRFSVAQATVAVTHGPSDWLWWATSTPLVVLTAGHEAVLLFFALSGFVLVRQLRVSPTVWPRYLAGRLVRLAVPTVFAVLLAAVLVVAVTRNPWPGASGWLTTWSATRLSGPTLLDSLDLFAGTYTLDNPLWSIRWEILFSLLLPVAVPVSSRLGPRSRFALPALVVIAAVSAAWGGQAFTFLPVFVAGGVLAVTDPRSGRVGRTRLSSEAIAAIILLCLPWMARTDLPAAHWEGIRTGCATTASLLLVHVVASSRAMDRVGAHFRFPGKVSFSLYLVHVPVIVTGAYLLHPTTPVALIALIGAAVTVGWVFSRIVEAPAHRLARAIQHGEPIRYGTFLPRTPAWRRRVAPDS